MIRNKKNKFLLYSTTALTFAAIAMPSIAMAAALDVATDTTSATAQADGVNFTGQAHYKIDKIADVISTAVTTTMDNQGQLIVNAAANPIPVTGTTSLALKNVTAGTATTNFAAGVFTHSMTIDGTNPVTITGGLASSNDANSALNFAVDGTLEHQSNLRATITTTGGGTLKSNPASADATIYGQIGTNTASLKAIEVSGAHSTTFREPIFADTLKIANAATKSVTAEKGLTSKTVVLSGANASFIAKDIINVETITTDTANKGKIEIGKNQQINADIAPNGLSLEEISLSNGVAVSFPKHVNAVQLKLGVGSSASIAPGQNIRGASGDASSILSFEGGKQEAGLATQATTIKAGAKDAETTFKDMVIAAKLDIVDNGKIIFEGVDTAGPTDVVKITNAVIPTLNNVNDIDIISTNVTASVQTIDAALGSKEKTFRNITIDTLHPVNFKQDIYADLMELKKNTKVTVADGKKIDATFTTSEPDQGTLSFAGDSNMTKQIGAKGKELASVEAGATTKTSIFAKDVYAKKMKYLGDGNIILKDKVNVFGDIEAGAVGGTLKTEGNASIKDIKAAGANKLASFDLTGSGKVIAGNIAATATNIAKNVELELRNFDTSKQIAIDGAVTNHGIFNIADNQLTVTGAFTAKQGSKTIVPVGLNQAFKVTGTGTFEDKTILSPRFTHRIEDGKDYTLAESSNAFVDPAKLTISQTALVSLTADFTTATKIVGKASVRKLADVTASPLRENAKMLNQFMDSLSPEDALQKTLVAGMQNLVNVADVNKATAKLTANTSVGLSKTIDSMNNNTISIMQNRLAELRNGDDLGVSAGSRYNMFRSGVWFKPFYNTATQNTGGNVASGYKSNTYGAIIGVDKTISDDTIIGVSFAYGKNKIKHADYKEGDRDNSNNYQFSVYGSRDIDRLETDLSLAFTRGNIKGTRDAGLEGGIVNSSYSAWSFRGDAQIGYRMDVGNGLIATPLASLMISRTSEDAYAEKGGNELYNRAVESRGYNNGRIGLGGKLSTTNKLASNWDFTPEVHAKALFDLGSKDHKSTVKLAASSSNINLPTIGSKSSRFGINIGGSVNMYSHESGIQAGISYDAELRKKYVSHTGMLKVKVNF